MKLLIEIFLIFLLMASITFVLQMLGIEAVIGSGFTAILSMIVGLWVAKRILV
jgi:uncharacterized MnhB-related membrane protein